jgi:prevent-host-death family protein
MKQVSISQLKNNLSRYLAAVRRREVALDRGRPVAQLVPIDQPAAGRTVGIEALAEMERKGLMRRGSGVIDRAILERDPPGRPCGVLEALLDGR